MYPTELGSEDARLNTLLIWLKDRPKVSPIPTVYI